MTPRQSHKLSRLLRSASVDLARSAAAPTPRRQMQRFERMVKTLMDATWEAEPILVDMKRKLHLTH